MSPIFWRETVPYICFESGQLQPSVRQELIRRLTEVSVEVTGIRREYFLVSVRELSDQSIAVGGLTVADIKLLETQPHN
jgi:4-oxalocrotonate tautomerase